jgi:plasmid stabilization system protein ParE
VSEFSVVLAPAAESDIEEAFHWYQGRDAAAADAFRAEALDAIDRLAADAMRWRVDANGNRRRLLKHFPYSVWFEVEADTVTILAVAHHRRLPGYWRI